ncbi:MAG: bacterial transcriptional activator domain-containing protein, partial [Gammaproteobacteria bacterium]
AAGRVRGGNLDGAVELYRRGIEVDPLREGLYRGLIDCYIRQDRRAEALEAYRHCRQMLSIVLGVQPSPETENLHARLLRASP